MTARLPGPPFHLLLVPFLLVGLALIFGGCSYVNAEKAVTAGYTAVGAASVMSRPTLQQCAAKALADKSESEEQSCHTGAVVMEKALPAAEDAVHAAADSVAAYAAFKAKDYSPAVLKMYRAMADLAQALIVAGVKLPAGVSLPGVN